ncbi:hypothetical protein FH972_009886 [Carpinus fangiana]|uniref:Uncharacterized protein n=1 Tax=Carpinus fangiana TaxID=176857 RepID=A0A660KPS3_9ROSI|nr:hypothetical protein FH972_009886 [Carpinus fangiana]
MRRWVGLDAGLAVDGLARWWQGNSRWIGSGVWSTVWGINELEDVREPFMDRRSWG